MMHNLMGSIHGAPTSSSGTFALGAPFIALLLAIAALCSMNWVASGTVTCGVFQCCSVFNGECRRMDSLSGLTWRARHRLYTTGAFLLMAVLLLALAVPLTLMSAYRRWAGGWYYLSTFNTFAGAIMVWVALFVSSSVPGGIHPSPQWITLWAALAATFGGFFALQAGGHAVVWLTLSNKHGTKEHPVGAHEMGYGHNTYAASPTGKQHSTSVHHVGPQYGSGVAKDTTTTNVDASGAASTQPYTGVNSAVAPQYSAVPPYSTTIPPPSTAVGPQVQTARTSV